MHTKVGTTAVTTRLPLKARPSSTLHRADAKNEVLILLRLAKKTGGFDG